MYLYYLRNYNNYYNRIFKKPYTFYDYEDYIYDTEVVDNFNPNDDVTTTITANIPDTTEIDYVLVSKLQRVAQTRWFVIDKKRNLFGQWELRLRRDLLADYFDELRYAPMFVEKGIVGYRDSRLYNSENMTFSQIRQPETRLYDKTGCPWVVGFVPSDAFTKTTDPETGEVIDVNETEVTKDIDVGTNVADIEIAGIENWVGYPYTQGATFSKFDTDYRIGLKWKYTVESILSDTTYNYYTTIPKTGDSSTTTQRDNLVLWDGTYNKTVGSSSNFDQINATRALTTAIQEDAALYSSLDYLWNNITNSVVQSYFGLDGQIIEDTISGKKYRIRLVEETTGGGVALYNQSYIISLLDTHFKSEFAPVTGGATQYTWSIEGEYKAYRYELDDVLTETSVTIKAARDHLEDAPYDMFCIPYGDITLRTTGGDFTSVKGVAKGIAQAIGETTGSGNVYDVQLLPYCPISEYYNNGVLDLTRIGSYSLIKTTVDNVETNMSALIWCNRSSFSFTIDYSIPEITNALEKKVVSMTHKYRLVAPGYTAAFEFDPQKNNGVEYFNVRCTYKPFSSYIRIAPNFKGMYQNDITEYDSRGLICSGNFSLTQLSSAWANYQFNNKNYLNIFARQIENLDVQQKYQRYGDIVGAVTGTIGGAQMGIAMGSAAGPIGMAAGGIIGGVGALGAGIADVAINDALRREAIDFTKDNFGYQLGNIQALPTTLARTEGINIDNALVPMLEVYIASDVEVGALYSKLAFNGMSVGTISTFSEQYNLQPSYLKGQLIRLYNVGTHETFEIANELNKGVYFLWE